MGVQSHHGLTKHYKPDRRVIQPAFDDKHCTQRCESDDYAGRAFVLEAVNVPWGYLDACVLVLGHSHKQNHAAYLNLCSKQFILFARTCVRVRQ